MVFDPKNGLWRQSGEQRHGPGQELGGAFYRLSDLRTDVSAFLTMGLNVGPTDFTSLDVLFQLLEVSIESFVLGLEKNQSASSWPLSIFSSPPCPAQFPRVFQFQSITHLFMPPLPFDCTSFAPFPALSTTSYHLSSQPSDILRLKKKKDSCHRRRTHRLLTEGRNIPLGASYLIWTVSLSSILRVHFFPSQTSFVYSEGRSFASSSSHGDPVLITSPPGQYPSTPNPQRSSAHADTRVYQKSSP